MRVLITRPREEAERLAALLAARGIDSLVEPLLEIRPVASPAPALDGVQALLFTSANGVRAFAARQGRRDLPVFAIGERTAEVAREAGFAQVESAEGDVAELAARARARLDPARGALLHAAGAVVKGDLAALLSPAGFAVRRVVLYEAVPASALSESARAALEGRALDAVLLFSPRTAETFVSLAEAAGLAAALRDIAAVCLSPAVADAVAAVAWREVRVAARPEQAALLALLGKREGGAGEVQEKSDKAAIPRAPEADGPIGRAIHAFGGIRPMAAKLGVPVTTVQGWKARGNIPEARRAEVLEAARKHGVALSEAELGEAPDLPARSRSGLSAEGFGPQAGFASAEAGRKAGPAAAALPPAETAASLPEPPASVPPTATAAAPTGASTHEPAKQSGAVEQTTGAVAKGRRGASRATVGLWVMAVAVLIFAAAAGLPYWGPLVGRGGDAAALGARLDALGSRLAALESRGPAPPPPEAGAEGGADLAGKVAQLADALGAQQRRMAAIERALADLATEERAGVDPAKIQALADALNALKGDDAKLATETRALADRLNRLEAEASRNAAADAARAALVLAVGQLATALAGPAPYAQPLAAVAALAQGDAELGSAIVTLQAHAATGVPTLVELAGRFDAVSVAAARAAIVPDRPGWIGELLTRLSRLVVIRRTGGDVVGEGPDAVLARGEARLKAGDLAGAAAALSTLEDGPAEAVKPWLADARARVAADAALLSLSARATARLAQPRL